MCPFRTLHDNLALAEPTDESCFFPPLLQATYAMGYNLAIEYMADYEKTWMLDAFRTFNERVLAPMGRPLKEWVFLEVGGSASFLRLLSLDGSHGYGPASARLLVVGRAKDSASLPALGARRAVEHHGNA
jgi:hypothetical protein